MRATIFFISRKTRVRNRRMDKLTRSLIELSIEAIIKSHSVSDLSSLVDLDDESLGRLIKAIKRLKDQRAPLERFLDTPVPDKSFCMSIENYMGGQDISVIFRGISSVIPLAEGREYTVEIRDITDEDSWRYKQYLRLAEKCRPE